MDQSSKSESVLLVVDGTDWSTVRSRVFQLIDQEKDAARIDVLLFMDDWSEALEAELRQRSVNQIKLIRGASLLDQVAVGARADLTEFVSVLRNRLVAMAWEVCGKKWGERFSRLWWYTRISQKNSALEDVWWHYFKFKAVCRQMNGQSYGRCLIVGEDALCSFVRSHCVRLGVNFSERQSVPAKFFFKTVLKRVYSGLGLAITVATAKLRFRSRTPRPRNPLVAFSWPEFWRDRHGAWQDIYYGGMLAACEKKSSADVVLALGLHGRAFMSFKEIKAQFKRLTERCWQDQRFEVIERYGSVCGILSRYFLQFTDILRFFRMSRSPNYQNAFSWQGVDFLKAFSPLLWDSALHLWPFFLCQEKMVGSLVSALQPAATIYYSFEFLAGRAMLAGIKRATKKPVIAMQHGPMTPMKLNYAGTSAETRPTPEGGEPRLDADIYVVDGTLSKTLLVASGINPDRVKITGGARFDEVWKTAVQSRNRRRFETQEIRILVAPTMHDPKFVIQCVLGALGDRTDVVLTIKPHPKSPGAEIRKMIGDFIAQKPVQCSVCLQMEGDIYGLMDETDLIIGSYSSTIVEALVFGVPPVLLVSHRKPDLSPFFGLGQEQVLRADSPESLKACLKRLMADAPFRRAYLAAQSEVVERVFGPVNGESSHAVAALLCGLADGNKLSE